MNKDLLKALDETHLAILNAQEKCDEALKEIEKIKLQNQVDPIMRKFDDLLKDLLGAGK